MQEGVGLEYNSNMDALFFSKNGELLPISQAVIPLSNIAYQYGFGVYETLKLRSRMLYFSSLHTERLFLSARLLDLSHPFTKELVEEWVHELIAKNNVQSCNIKLLLLGGKTAADAELFILLLNPLYPDRKLYSEGAKTQTVSYERFLPNAKSLNMLQSYLAFTKAKQNGCYDALLVDKSEHILEGTRTNFFAIKEKTLVTAPKQYVLEGVTRQVVFAVAKAFGYSFKEELISVSSLQNFSGAFFTSTSSDIMPIRQINSFSFSKIAPELKEFMIHYNAFLLDCKGEL